MQEYTVIYPKPSKFNVTVNEIYMYIDNEYVHDTTSSYNLNNVCYKFIYFKELMLIYH